MCSTVKITRQFRCRVICRIRSTIKTINHEILTILLDLLIPRNDSKDSLNPAFWLGVESPPGELVWRSARYALLCEFGKASRSTRYFVRHSSANSAPVEAFWLSDEVMNGDEPIRLSHHWKICLEQSMTAAAAL
jgi:hypothetical protein